MSHVTSGKNNALPAQWRPFSSPPTNRNGRDRRDRRGHPPTTCYTIGEPCCRRGSSPGPDLFRHNLPGIASSLPHAALLHLYQNLGQAKEGSLRSVITGEPGSLRFECLAISHHRLRLLPCPLLFSPIPNPNSQHPVRQLKLSTALRGNCHSPQCHYLNRVSLFWPGFIEAHPRLQIPQDQKKDKGLTVLLFFFPRLCTE